jgi:hypothetical protein
VACPVDRGKSITITCARRNAKMPTAHSTLFTSFLSIPISPIPFPFPSSSRHTHCPFAVSLACDVVRPCLLRYPLTLTVLTITLAPFPSSPSIHSAPQCGYYTYLRRLGLYSHRLLTDISTSTCLFITLLSRYLFVFKTPSDLWRRSSNRIVYLPVCQS